MSRSRSLRVGALVLAVLLVGACGNDDAADGSSTTTVQGRSGSKSTSKSGSKEGSTSTSSASTTQADSGATATTTTEPGAPPNPASGSPTTLPGGTRTGLGPGLTTGDPGPGAAGAASVPTGFCEYGQVAGELLGGYSEALSYDDMLEVSADVLRAFQTLADRAPAEVKADVDTVVAGFASSFAVMSDTTTVAELAQVMKTDAVTGVVNLPAFGRLATWFVATCGPPR